MKHCAVSGGVRGEVDGHGEVDGVGGVLDLDEEEACPVSLLAGLGLGDRAVITYCPMAMYLKSRRGVIRVLLPPMLALDALSEYPEP